MLMLLLSAIIYSLSFISPKYFGWLIIFWWLPCVIFFKKYSFGSGFIWGLIVWGSHFIWLLFLLINKSYAHWSLAFLLYFLIIIFFSFTSGFLFWGYSGIVKLFKDNFLTRAFVLLLSWLLYINIILNFGSVITGKLEGYPFANPLIPLVNYKFIAKIILFFSHIYIVSPGGSSTPEYLKSSLDKISFISPASWGAGGLVTEAQGPIGCGQSVFHELSRLLSHNTVGESAPIVVDSPTVSKESGALVKSSDKLKIICAPESTFPFSLNKYPEILLLWSGILPKKTHFFLGAQMTVDKKIYQVVYWINQGRIINCYVKKHRVPFVEYMPKFWRIITPFTNIFLKEHDAFAKPREGIGVKSFRFSHDFSFYPQVCSELFYINSGDTRGTSQKEKAKVILFFVNDSWFINFFKDWLERLAYLRALVTQCPIIYCAHSKGRVISPVG
jgi:hypothetical protein